MASIDASTSGAGGIITTADNTGTLNLQSGGTTIATINSTGLSMASGKVLAPTGPAFSAYVASNQAITSSANVKIPFNTEEFDTANCYDNATNYRFTPNVAGYYQINAAVGTIGGSTRSLPMIWKNGAEVKRGNDCAASVNGVVVSALVYANGSTDYFEIYVFTNATGTNLGGGNYLTYFQAFLARAA